MAWLKTLGPLAKRALDERRIEEARRKAKILQRDEPKQEEAKRDIGPAALDLLDFIPTITPRWERPTHLEEIADIFRRIDRGEGVRECFSAPPQHGKTELILHGIAWLLRRHPTWPIAFVGYGQDLANSKSRLARDYALRAGVKLRTDSKSVKNWMTIEGGGLWATSITGSLTGQPAMAVFIDDSFKGREDSESETYRDKVEAFLYSVAEPRAHPGASIVCSHTRWHDDDLIGRCLKKFDENGKPIWRGHNLPAIDEHGRPLWHRRPLDFLNAKRQANEFDWWSLWMGNPRPRGGGLFRGSFYFHDLPQSYRIGKGLDCAYTKNTRADASCGLVMLQSGDKFYVVDVQLNQVELDEFVPQLRVQSKIFDGTYLFRTSSTEKGIAQFSKLLPETDIRIKAKRAMNDKFTAAQPLATAWKNGRVLLPDEHAIRQLEEMGLTPRDWVQRFVRTMNRMTGVADKFDDEMDAAINAHDTFPRFEQKPGKGGIVQGIPIEDRQLGD